MAAITQTIAIVDRSNKVVSTSKQLKNVFKEAKIAYLERKAELVAERRAKEERQLRKSMKAMTMAEDARSDTSHRSSGHRSRRGEHGHDRERPSAGGHHYSADSLGRQGFNQTYYAPSTVSAVDARPNLAQFNEELYGHYRSAPTSPIDHHERGTLARRTTDLPLDSSHPHRPPPMRSHSTSDMEAHIDMDLAYGEFHPESLMLDPKVEQTLQKQEMSSLVLKCKLLMEEANCAQHSVKAIIAHLQKNPDAMAAVALTLAEISNLASKMAPAALMAFKTGAPTVFAILAAPEFLIAVGVGVGLTVVMFGGYKIIKKIKARIGDKEGDPVDEMLDVHELDRIDHWRRGISDVETASVSTSVEGEFITPMAAASMGHLPLPRERAEDKHRGKKRAGSRRKHSVLDEDPDRTLVGSDRSKSRKSSKSEKREKALVKVKKPSPLRRMFAMKDTDSLSRR
ncbi:hypothetical protein A1O1_00483 [Capronia coronata CBS 617.96]|uniref:Uncharacterized protein n=1 Tax=Capronia coronata CBS 617.96 TaxID=1182541 RepID=W9YR75_9EURO|nr:uncharacterized protein A1O1_00483 [Capronia coronata CBS 617.96]EXJ95362.1 hypothetical protein A1O1_00483 [Capronia coronata CBS 617.96]